MYLWMCKVGQRYAEGTEEAYSKYMIKEASRQRGSVPPMGSMNCLNCEEEKKIQ